MADTEPVTDRVRRQLAGRGELTENRVFDGVGFFVDGRMAVAVLGDAICVHIEEKSQPPSAGGEAADPFLFAGRPVPGWVSIPAESMDDETLGRWVAMGLAGVSSPM